mgnify:CR=1 FL=1
MNDRLIDKTVQSFKARALQEIPNNISQIYLFGSCAKGTYGDDSDIDVFVVIDGYDANYREYRDKLLTISDDLSISNHVVLSVVMSDKSDWEKNKDFLLLYKNILREGKCYHG